MGTLKKICLLFCFVATCFGMRAQHVALKTNLVSDALLSPNLGVEIGLKPHWSLNLVGQGNFWTVNDHKWKHWLVQPEARYWFCEYFGKHFVGVHALGGEYNFGFIKNDINFLGSDFSQLTDYRFQGWAVGGGISYGYAFMMAKHWNIELELGIGYLYTRYNKYRCKDCGKKVEGPKDHNYYGPTKAAVNLVYVF